ncbi:undecaprenyl-phosphate glucose phosphotransferase [Aliiglaciecola sp. 2_MG-2023]|uniref:undecaprenyl-phosphate glucose phosphotransferase n=1 Tax=unclassified Aliiglaciecola TaxID=2593648 RepID=UPI0026E2EF6B|nr:MULTISPECIES: undecaprenyl-phosphate glucose phosphotransferase [unclassified Aliiglaciecola]MDO6712887.1 undecaprenyl-phosphate glucose phosphotransferase [Aliiglaciecola sp. 2_MG-2023]MDO6752877.1 undecaprenyl-phosphate glucose phosphotransferase [Aliiglaciecola sp. 1_MG-2023]
MNMQSGMVKNNTNKFAAAYRLVDVVVIQFALFSAVLLYGLDYTKDYFTLSLIGSVSFALVAESFALYRSWRAGFFKQIVFYTFLCWACACMLILGYLFFFKIAEDYSRFALAIWFAMAYMALVGWRIIFQLFLHNMRRKGYNTRSIAIFGLSEKGIRLANEVMKSPETGYRLTAVFDDRGPERLDSKYHYLLHGNVEKGIDCAKRGLYDVIYIALPIKAQHRIQEMLYQLGDTTANVHVVPDLFMYCLMHGEMSHVGGVQTISVYDNPMQGGIAIVKRLEDILLSLSILSLISIPMLAIAAAVKLTSKGPIIFKQDRYGLNGKKIKVWKFRSMSVTENSDNVVQATKGDARITKVGAFLRRTSLDELPQFINVLKGDMSVIGPRPHAVKHNEEYRKLVDYYMLRHKVKPGITGWAQVNGWRGETDTVEKMKMRIEYDLEYIRNWSLWMDFKIVIFTVFRSFTDKNAY